MKQQPTQKQWDELNIDEMLRFWGSIKSSEKEEFNIATKKPTIGQLIEFLGNDWVSHLRISEDDGGLVYMKCNILCDRLWETVKHKLRA